MRRIRRMLVVLLLTAAGCGPRDETGPVANPKQAAHQLDQAFAGAPESFRKAAADAASALQSGDLGRAVESLGVLRASEGVSVDQGLAVHNSMVLLESRLLERLESGDAEAQKAYALLKKLKQK